MATSKCILTLGLMGLVAVGCSNKHRESAAATNGEAGEASSAAGGRAPDASSGGVGGDSGSKPDDTLTCQKEQYYDGSACKDLTACGAGETESVPPTRTSDRVCSRCGAGKYEANGECAELTMCEPGNRQTSAPTATSDRECAPCSAGTFASSTNAEECAPWTECAANQAETTPGTAASDAECTDKAACPTDDDRTCTTECPCSSTEGVCTANDQCASGTSCVAGSGKKVGRTGDTCLATHCNNDKLDDGETSVDCGGDCGCRVTFETISVKGIPSGASGFDFKAMSRDGTHLVGSFGRGQSSYPASIAAEGTITELETYGKGGTAFATSADGSLVVGAVACANPPTCSDSTASLVQWKDASAPKVLIFEGTPRAMSSSGSVIAGDFYDTSVSKSRGFLFSGNQRVTIPELAYVSDLSPDGKYVTGSLQTGAQAGLWSAQTQTLTKIGSTSWSSTTVKAANGTDPVVVGFGYINASDSYIGFRWKGGVLTELGVLSGGKYSLPSDVSASGSVIIGTTGTNTFGQAFVWTEQDELRSLVDVLKERGLEPPVDFALGNALFVSDDGKTIVGSENTQPPSFWRVILN